MKETFNNNNMGEAFNKIAEQRARNEESRKQAQASAAQAIEQATGKSSGYTITDVRAYLAQFYGAKAIPFEEALEYIPDKFHIVGQCRTEPDPLSYLTENWLSSNAKNEIFLLPPRQEQTNSLHAPKNGCILIIENNGGLPSSWWIGGNKSGYAELYNTQMPILCNGKKGSW